MLDVTRDGMVLWVVVEYVLYVHFADVCFCAVVVSNGLFTIVQD